MLKSKKILRDLKHGLKGSKTIFGTYDSHNMKESKNLDMSVLDVVRALAPYEVDFKKLYGVDFDSLIYEGDEYFNDDVDWYDLKDAYISEDDLENCKDNSYNWNSQIIFDFGTVIVNELIDEELGDYHPKKYQVIKFHRYGDVRGNYTDYMVLDMDHYEFLETLQEASTVEVKITYKNKDYYISSDCLKEDGMFNISSDDNLYLEDCTSLNIDNYRSMKSIKKGLVEYLNK